MATAEYQNLTYLNPGSQKQCHTDTVHIATKTVPTPTVLHSSALVQHA